MRLEVGKRYITRSGVVVRLAMNDYYKNKRWVSPVDGPYSFYIYETDGSFHACYIFGPSDPHPADIVSEVDDDARVWVVKVALPNDETKTLGTFVSEDVALAYLQAKERGFRVGAEKIFIEQEGIE